MASRTALNNRDRQKLRDKIQSDKIIRELQAFGLGIKLKRNNGGYHVPNLTALKVKTLFGLLDRTLPAIRAEEVATTTEEVVERVISASALSEDEWTDQYGPQELPEGVTPITAAKDNK